MRRVVRRQKDAERQADCQQRRCGQREQRKLGRAAALFSVRHAKVLRLLLIVVLGAAAARNQAPRKVLISGPISFSFAATMCPVCKKSAPSISRATPPA